MNRRYTLNESYFEKIDTEEKAYFLGLLYADGCNKTANYAVCLSLQERDREILEKFKVAIESSKPLYFANINRKNKNWQNTWSLVIASKKISNRLIELGCVPSKSLILRFPTEEQVPKHLINHFIRGYFDGDGCFCLTKKTDYQCCIVSSVFFLEKLKEKISQELNINCSISSYKKRKNNSRYMSIGGRVQVMEFLDWIYKDATIYLKRKYDKYRHGHKIYKDQQNIRANKFRKMIGTVWNNITLVDVADRKIRDMALGIFKCHCGKIFQQMISRIKTGQIKSCGCFKSRNKNSHYVQYKAKYGEYQHEGPK